MNVRRIVFWIVVAGILFWIVSNPTRAGHTGSHLVNEATGAVGACADAIVAFFTGLNL